MVLQAKSNRDGWKDDAAELQTAETNVGELKPGAQARLETSTIAAGSILIPVKPETNQCETLAPALKAASFFLEYTCVYVLH